MNSGQLLTITNRERESNKGIPLLGIRDLTRLGRGNGNGKENVKKETGLMDKTTTLKCELLTLFCQFLCCPCTTATSLVKWPNLKSSEDHER